MAAPAVLRNTALSPALRQIGSVDQSSVFGGSLFLGAFFFSITGMFHLTRTPYFGNTLQKSNVPLTMFEGMVDPELRRLLPFMLASLVSYTVGICFLSRSYIVPTYMMLGITTVYLRMCAAQAPMPLLNFNRYAALRLAGASFVFIIGAFIFVRTFVHY